MSNTNAGAEAARLMLLGLLSEATEEEQAAYAAAKRDIDDVVARHGDIGVVALTVAVAQFAAGD